MITLEMVFLVWLGALIAGLLGALTGLGGGVVIVPLLVLVFGVDIRYAMGASLVSVIATSCGAAAVYVREGFSNIRIGMFLEMATAAGAVLGASLTFSLPTDIIGIIFGIVLLISAGLAVQGKVEPPGGEKPDRLGSRLRMDSSYPTPEGPRSYRVSRVPGGFGVMFGAGTVSGLLGIGSGPFKVLAMDQVMRIPFKVSTTTSNFMIGVTAATSAGFYLRQGYVAPGLAMPVVLGTLLGAAAGTHLLVKSRPKWLRLVFSLVIAVMGVEMIYGALTGKL